MREHGSGIDAAHRIPEDLHRGVGGIIWASVAFARSLSLRADELKPESRRVVSWRL